MSDSIKKYEEMMEDGKWSTDSTGYSYNNLPKDPIVLSVIDKYKSRSRDGIIKSISVINGETVNKNQLLIEFE